MLHYSCFLCRAPHERKRAVIIANSMLDRLEEIDSLCVRHEQEKSGRSSVCSDVAGRTNSSSDTDSITDIQTCTTIITDRKWGGRGIATIGMIGTMFPFLIGKKVHPKFVEWMMGFPEDWTNPDCNLSATQLCQEYSIRSSGQSDTSKQESRNDL